MTALQNIGILSTTFTRSSPGMLYEFPHIPSTCWLPYQQTAANSFQTIPVEFRPSDCRGQVIWCRTASHGFMVKQSLLCMDVCFDLQSLWKINGGPTKPRELVCHCRLSLTSKAPSHLHLHPHSENQICRHHQLNFHNFHVNNFVLKCRQC